MHRTNDGDDEAQGSCGAHFPAVSRPAARGAVIQSNRRAPIPHCPAAEVSPPEASAPPSIGLLVQAVVLRTANKRLKLFVLRTTGEEVDGPEI